jgi:hypothetical protein
VLAVAVVAAKLSIFFCMSARMVRTLDERFASMAVEAPSENDSSGTGGLVLLPLAKCATRLWSCWVSCWFCWTICAR